jgi:hypothetical protein
MVTAAGGGLGLRTRSRRGMSNEQSNDPTGRGDTPADASGHYPQANGVLPYGDGSQI